MGSMIHDYDNNDILKCIRKPDEEEGNAELVVKDSVPDVPNRTKVDNLIKELSEVILKLSSSDVSDNDISYDINIKITDKRTNIKRTVRGKVR